MSPLGERANFSKYLISFFLRLRFMGMKEIAQVYTPHKAQESELLLKCWRDAGFSKQAVGGSLGITESHLGSTGPEKTNSFPHADPPTCCVFIDGRVPPTPQLSARELVSL